MIGLLITGHGNFATGVTSSVDLIAGKQENYQAVDFLPTYNLDDLDREMTKALENLKACSGVLILCDLLGGTPFNKAAELTGIILTKLDGTAKGGIVVAISAGLGVPVKLVGVGEGLDDLMDFNRDEFLEALLPPIKEE